MAKIIERGSNMARSNFDKELTEMKQKVLSMGGAVEEAIDNSVKALKNQDSILAQKVIENDDIIDDLELEIEKLCMRLIAQHQPMANDLRRVGTALKIITELERMGDYASSISKKTLYMVDEPLIKPLVDLPRMAKLTQQMVEKALDAYVNENSKVAYEIAEEDDEIDALHKQIFSELITYMISDPKTINQSTQLLFISSSLERIGDHSTNLAEWIIFMVTGKREKF